MIEASKVRKCGRSEDMGQATIHQSVNLVLPSCNQHRWLSGAGGGAPFVDTAADPMMGSPRARMVGHGLLYLVMVAWMLVMVHCRFFLVMVACGWGWLVYFWLKDVKKA